MKIKKDEELWKNYIDDTFVAGVTKLLILGKIKHRSTYPYELYKQLKKHHFGPIKKISKSDVYNILNALENKGLVKSESILSGLKVQKKYSITREGSRISKEAKKLLVAHLEDIKKLIKYEFE